jgi:hypothetical protein
MTESPVGTRNTAEMTGNTVQSLFIGWKEKRLFYQVFLYLRRNLIFSGSFFPQNDWIVCKNNNYCPKTTWKQITKYNHGKYINNDPSLGC